MTKIYKKLATAFWFGLAAFSACAFEHGLMRIPDSFAPRREVVVNGEGYENAVSIPLPGDGSMMLQNEMGGGVLSSPIPVHAVEAVEAFLEKYPGFSFEVIDEYYGYHKVLLAGWLWMPGTHPKDMTLSLGYFTGDVVYNTEKSKLNDDRNIEVFF